MSSRASLAAVQTAMLVLAATALVPSLVYAATPNTAAKKEKAEAQTTTLPSTKPGPTTVRSLASSTRQTPFGEAIDLLRNSTTPPLKIIVLWKPLNSAGVYRDTPIGIDGLAGLRAGQVLELLTLSLSAGASAKIGYTVDKGVITISTTDALPSPKPVVRVHDVSDLVAPPARYSLQSMGFGMGYGGQMAPFGTYPGSLGAGLSSPTGGIYGNAGQAARTYRSR
jgi:hypothetical protein